MKAPAVNKRAGDGMVFAPSSVAAGCLLRHHLKACMDPSLQHVLLLLQNQTEVFLRDGCIGLCISAL